MLIVHDEVLSAFWLTWHGRGESLPIESKPCPVPGTLAGIVGSVQTTADLESIFHRRGVAWKRDRSA